MVGIVDAWPSSAAVPAAAGIVTRIVQATRLTQVAVRADGTDPKSANDPDRSFGRCYVGIVYFLSHARALSGQHSGCVTRIVATRGTPSDAHDVDDRSTVDPTAACTARVVTHGSF